MNPQETLQEKIRRVTREKIEIVPYNPEWIQWFQSEKKHLQTCLPSKIITRIEHFGSTAVPGLPSKPVVDMLVEVPSLEDIKTKIPPILEAQGYDYFWRPSFGDDVPPFYAWFIKRNNAGIRTHHIHMVEPDFEHWNRLYFRDYLIEKPEIAGQYAELKTALSKRHPGDRVAYTKGKTEFILKFTRIAADYYSHSNRIKEQSVPSIRQKTIGGLKAGDSFTVTRKFTEQDVNEFADMSKDYNPIHFDERFTAAKQFKGRICHGLLVGSMITEIGGQIGWLASGMSFKFKKPVYFDETITCIFTLAEVEERGRAKADVVWKNQKGTVVIEASLTGILPGEAEKKIMADMMAEGDPTNKI